MEGDLARVKDALAATEEARAVAEEARFKAESETARLEVDRTSLLLVFETVKDEVSSLQSQVGKDKMAMEEEYQKALKVIFAYGTGVVFSNTTSMETVQRSQRVCLIPPTRCLLSSS